MQEVREKQCSKMLEKFLRHTNDMRRAPAADMSISVEDTDQMTCKIASVKIEDQSQDVAYNTTADSTQQQNNEEAIEIHVIYPSVMIAIGCTPDRENPEFIVMKKYINIAMYKNYIYRIRTHFVACTHNWSALNVRLKVHAPVQVQIKSNHLKSFPVNISSQILVKSRKSKPYCSFTSPQHQPFCKSWFVWRRKGREQMYN